VCHGLRPSAAPHASQNGREAERPQAHAQELLTAGGYDLNLRPLGYEPYDARLTGQPKVME
jgi:hypothetical protein